jgi:hypothetical protein
MTFVAESGKIAELKTQNLGDYKRVETTATQK